MLIFRTHTRPSTQHEPKLNGNAEFFSPHKPSSTANKHLKHFGLSFLFSKCNYEETTLRGHQYEFSANSNNWTAENCQTQSIYSLLKSTCTTRLLIRTQIYSTTENSYVQRQPITKFALAAPGEPQLVSEQTSQWQLHGQVLHQDPKPPGRNILLVGFK